MKTIIGLATFVSLILGFIGFQFYSASQVSESGYYMEVLTQSVHNDGRQFTQLFKLEPNSGLQGKYLEHDFYCVYWLKEEITEYPKQVVTGAGVDCQPCHQDALCEGNTSFSVDRFDGSAKYELSRDSLWKHRIKFIKLN